MKLTQSLEHATVGEMVHALANFVGAGVPLSAPIELKRNRSSEIVEMTVDTETEIDGNDAEETAPAPEMTPQGAAEMLADLSGGETPDDQQEA